MDAARAGRVLGMAAGNILGLRVRAGTSTTLPLLDAYAGLLGYDLHVLLVEDDPGVRRPGWRERMPHGDVTGDDLAMSEPWHLQRHLHTLRRQAGLTRGEVAEALGIAVLALWRLETNPVAIDAAMMNVLMYARFFGYTVRLHLVEPLEMSAVGKWIGDDGGVVYDGKPVTGDDEDHPDVE
ncbi:helix-turn-helix transcriptional regulator [Amycolatopsis sp. NPDC051373]|uniref:helix-turn-helix domain-containing protein n=1 Tax=Amycolatopsis sp. NPDC051373 TaxID=3155801 RepID=UPI00344FF35C